MDLLALTQKGFDAFNDRTLREAFEDHVHPDIVSVNAARGQEFHGREAFYEFADGAFGALPDVQSVVLSQAVSGNTVTATSRLRGYFSGQLETPNQTYQGTDYVLEMDYKSTWEFNDEGKLVRFSIDFDLQEFNRQLRLR